MNIKETVFCFTGKCPKTRVEMELIAIRAGASVTQSVNGKTTILVIANVNIKSRKAELAKCTGIDLISPTQFFQMCNNPTESNVGDTISKINISTPSYIDKLTDKKRHSSIRHIQL